jgi:DNA-binding MarR family transcriptional regulator
MPEPAEPPPEPAQAPVPLSRLFAMATRYLIDELHKRLAERGWPELRPAFGFTLLAARDQQPLTSGGIASLLGMTKQAASKLVDAMEELGFVRRRPIADDARAKLVELTPKGRRLLAEVERVYAELEAEWADIVGRKQIESLRTDLQAVLLAVHGGRLPAIRPTW